jgi:hypothetical protein
VPLFRSLIARYLALDAIRDFPGSVCVALYCGSELSFSNHLSPCAFLFVERAGLFFQPAVGGGDPVSGTPARNWPF